MSTPVTPPLPPSLPPAQPRRAGADDFAGGSSRAAAARAAAAAGTSVRSVVFVCHGPSCTERGSPDLCKQLRERLNESSARRAVRVCETTCLDHCATGPNVLLSHEGAIQAGLAPEGLHGLVTLLVGGGAPGEARGATGEHGALDSPGSRTSNPSRAPSDPTGHPA